MDRQKQTDRQIDRQTVTERQRGRDTKREVYNVFVNSMAKL